MSGPEGLPLLCRPSGGSTCPCNTIGPAEGGMDGPDDMGWPGDMDGPGGMTGPDDIAGPGAMAGPGLVGMPCPGPP